MGVNENEEEQSRSEEDEAPARMTHETALQHVDGLLQYLEEQNDNAHLAEKLMLRKVQSRMISVKKGCSVPVLIGSGVTAANLCDYLQANAVIVGTHFKHNGQWQNEVDVERVKVFMDKMHQARLKTSTD
uniref:Uncharacterized protein n=1 Tax=Timema bartmani TaxID=61472 RepID=A0A7R9EXZ8_9NEOP|nr:unnamed protein product [Timema bartmani]